MTRYLLYFLTGFAHALVILFYRGYLDAAPTTYSTIALVSGMALFGIASWLKLFLEKIGALMAVICVVAITPWTVEAGREALSHDAFLSGVLVITHAVLLFFALATFVTSLRYVISKGSWLTGTTNPGFITKIIISIIPIAIIIIWLLIMGKIQ
jgi:hypothetical protein